MILFRKIRWKNFLSTGNYFTEIEFDSSPNTLVVGENGAGKSTMLDALCFVLFGKPFRSVNKPQLLNSINSKDCVVEIEFNVGNKAYKIIRGIKPNIFEIYCDGDLINQDAAVRDYQEYLEKFVIKLNYKSFTQIVILGSASFTPFMQLSASDRRSIIEELLDIQIFSAMNNIIKEKMSINKETMNGRKHEIDLAQQKHDMQKKHIDELKQNNDEKVKEYQKEIANNQIIIQELTANSALYLTKVGEYTSEVADKLDTEAKLKTITKLESQIESNLSKYRKDINFFQQNDNCPTCRQAIELGFKEEELSSLHTKKGDCEQGLKKLESKLLQEQTKLNLINEKQKEIQQLQIKIATNNTSIIETEKYIKKVENQIKELKENKASTEKETTQLKELEGSLLKLQAELKQLIEEKTYYEVASGLLKDTGIKTKIIKQYLPIINKLVNKYLASFDFFVNFDSSLDANGTEYLMTILQMLEGTDVFVISHKGDILQDKFRNVIKFEKIKNFSRIMK